MTTQYTNSLIGCRLNSNKHSNNTFSLRRRVLSDAIMIKANRAITFNGRHFIINFDKVKDIPGKALSLIEEKVRLTNLFIEDVLEAQDQNIAILTPCGTTVPLCGEINEDCPQYSAVVSWYHIRLTLDPEVIKKGLRSGWSIAGLPLTKQIFKVACHRSRTNLRAINNSIWFEYDILNEKVCCHSGVKIEGA